MPPAAPGAGKREPVAQIPNSFRSTPLQAPEAKQSQLQT